MTKKVQATSPVAASTATTRPCPPLSPLATPTNTLPAACMGAVVTVSPATAGTLPTVVAQTSSPVSCRSAATCTLRSPTNTRSPLNPTPCHDGAIRDAASSACQRHRVSPVAPSTASTLAPAVR